MPSSRKTSVIEALFWERFRGEGKPLIDARVTLQQVEDAIRKHNEANPGRRLSTKNPANFFKDFVRVKRSANQNWPTSVFARGYSARQLTGEGLCFEFIPTAPSQTEAFPITGIYKPPPDSPLRQLQAVSISLASRALGRSDEAWLLQVMVRLHAIETHLSAHPTRCFLQVDLLQTNVKLARAEIDALFLATEEKTPTSQRQVIITLEAKGLRDDILEEQIVAQVKAAFRMLPAERDIVMPMAAKAIAPSKVYVVQFAPIERSLATRLSPLVLETEAVYVLVPPIPGVGE